MNNETNSSTGESKAKKDGNKIVTLNIYFPDKKEFQKIEATKGPSVNLLDKEAIAKIGAENFVERPLKTISRGEKDKKLSEEKAKNKKKPSEKESAEKSEK